MGKALPSSRCARKRAFAPVDVTVSAFFVYHGVTRDKGVSAPQRLLRHATPPLLFLRLSRQQTLARI